MLKAMLQMSQGKPLIDIIIPSWNGRKMLAACLDSLKQQSSKDFGVIVVDNGSNDGTVEWLEHDFPLVKLVKFDRNTGFSVAINAGILASSAEWLFLLNNDMEVAPDCLEILINSINRYPDYHFFALKMLSFYNRDILDGAGDAVLRGGVGYRIGTLEKDSELYSHNREIFGACAGAGLYSKEFFNQAGLFDADFFAYLEDVDLNMRARKLGLRCMFLADARVYHIGSATTGSKINSTTIRLSTRNNFAVIIKNYPLKMILRFLPAIFVYQLLWGLFCVKKKVFRAYMHGLFEVIRSLKNTLKKRTALKDANAQWPDTSQVFANRVKAAENDALRSIMARRTAEGKNNFVFELYCKLFF